MHSRILLRSLVILGLSLALTSCGLLKPAGVRDVSPQDLAREMGRPDGPIVVDARSPEEFAAGHVPGAINIPHDQMAGRVHELDAFQGREIVTYCEHGVRSARAQRVLLEAGFRDVGQLAGDMPGWRSSGQPIEK